MALLCIRPAVAGIVELKNFTAMECKMIETAAYEEMKSLVARLCSRMAHLTTLSAPLKPDK